jgi:hypothetical protein
MTLTGHATVPDYRAVIRAVTRRDKARVVIDGMTAANDLGLTTAVPARIEVLVDARLKPIKLGKPGNPFQVRRPQPPLLGGSAGMRVVQALHWMQDMLTQDGEREAYPDRRCAAFSPTPSTARRSARICAPVSPRVPIWMQEFLREILLSATRTREAMSSSAYRQIIAAPPRDRLDLFLATANRIGSSGGQCRKGFLGLLDAECALSRAACGRSRGCCSRAAPRCRKAMASSSAFPRTSTSPSSATTSMRPPRSRSWRLCRTRSAAPSSMPSGTRAVPISQARSTTSSPLNFAEALPNGAGRVEIDEADPDGQTLLALVSRGRAA